MYKFIEERTENNRRVRVYKNQSTGTESKTTPIYKDNNGVEWWGFTDLYKIPYMRIAYSKHIADMFTMGLSLADILKWCADEKALLKGNDPDKYEKLYALILEKERLANYTADPIKLHLALCSVYVLREEEAIDQFSDAQAQEKLLLWAVDREAQAFFLTWHNEHMQNFWETLAGISQTVSTVQNLKR